MSITKVQAVRRRPTKLKEWEVASDMRDRERESVKRLKHQSRGQPSEHNHKADEENGEGEKEENGEEDESAPGDLDSGVVLERYGDRLLVELGCGSRQGETIVCCQKTKLSETTIVVGDRVSLILQEGSSNSSTGNNDFQGVVTCFEPRKTLLQRPLPSGSRVGMKAIAANVDQVVVVVCAQPKVPSASIDRILVAAREYGMEALLVLNKCDDVEGTQQLRKELYHYPHLGYNILEVSVEFEEGLEALKLLLQGKCSVLVGQSGVGKSSLVNALLGPDVSQQKVGSLVRNANIGAHTTSSARLFHIPGGGELIDSPGIRELGVWHLPVEAIHAGFFEVTDAAKRCRFRNCAHTEGSPGCAVLEAVKQGDISNSRLEHWRELTR